MERIQKTLLGWIYMTDKRYLRLKLTLMSPTGRQETGEILIDGKMMSAGFTCTDISLPKQLYEKDIENGLKNIRYNKKLNMYITIYPNYSKVRMLRKIMKELKKSGIKVTKKHEEI